MLQNEEEDGNGSEEERRRHNSEDRVFEFESEVKLVSELGTKSPIGCEIEPGRHVVGCAAGSSKIEK